MNVSIYRLQDGGYQTSFVDPVLNRRVRARFKLLNQAKAYQKNILLQNRNANLITHSSAPLTKFIPMYREKFPGAAMFNRSPFLYESFSDAFGKMPVNEINKMHLTQWFEKIQKEKDYAARTMVLIKYCFNPFFTYLCGLGVIGKNPMVQVKMSKFGHRKNERVYLAESEVRDIMDQLRIVSPLEIHPVSYFQLHTASYIGEVVKLRWNQIDLGAGTVSFPATGNASDRKLPLSPRLSELLKTLPQCGDFVFVKEDGEPWTVPSYYRKFARIRAKIAVRRSFDSYAFRHTFAYHFLRKGGTLTQLQALLGHRSIDMTVFMYGSIVDKKTEKTTPYEF